MSFKRTRCPHCRGKLEAGQRIHPGCIDGYAEAQAAKADRTRAKTDRMAAKVDKAETRQRKEAIKRIPDLTKEAQIAFNSFIRERDRQAGHACISSGRPLDWSGNQVDAGHYRSTGAASHLRFHEDNCHAQSKHDNKFLAGNAVEYRSRLIARIGLARVESLEANNTPVKWTRDQLREIRDTCRAKTKELKKHARETAH